MGAEAMIRETDDNSADDAGTAVRVAARAVAAGGVVVYPTETYYALGVDPCRVDALEAVSRLKGRASADKPLLLLIDSLEVVSGWTARVPEAFAPLVARFWPGPLTLVLPAVSGAPNSITGGGRGVALRWTPHPLARELIASCGGALTGTSANRTGEAPADNVAMAVEAFGDDIAAVVDGGRTAGGEPSTVLDLTGPRPSVLRAGAVPVAEIAEVVGLL
jgi:L-threonylcarbamoyladenylate synthase